MIRGEFQAVQVDAPRRLFPSYDGWRAFLARAAVALAAVLLGAGVVCLVAANWPGMDKWQRFALVQAMLAALSVAAAFCGRSPRDGGRGEVVRDALAAAAGLVLGALLALVGQTYQTGADAWQLFAGWAALLLAWAAAAGGALTWMLWALVFNAALWLGVHDAGFDGVLDTGRAAGGVMGLANAGLLAAWEGLAARRGIAGRGGPRLLAALMLGAPAASFVLGRLDAGAIAVLAVWLAVAAGAWAAYRRRRFDPVILAMAALAAIAVAARLAGQWLFDALGDGAALALAVLLVAASAWAARWIARAAGRSRADGAPASSGPPTDGEPWYARALLAAGAWVATLLLLVFLVAADVVDGPGGALVAGACLMAGAAWAACAGQGAFLRQAAAAAGLAGLALAGYGLAEAVPSGVAAWAGWLALAALLYALAPVWALRLGCGLAMALAMGGAVHGLAGGDAWHALGRLAGDGQTGLRLWLLAALAGLAATLFALSGGRAGAARPLAWSCAAAAQGLAWLAHGVPLDRWPAWLAGAPASALALAAVACLPAAVAAWILHSRGGVTQPAALRLGLPAALLALALLWLPAPGAAVALMWPLLGQACGSRRLGEFGALSLAVYLARYYYQQQVPLLDKGMWLCATGVAVGLLYLAALRTRRQAPADKPPAGRSGWRRPAAALASLALSLGAANAVIAGHERLLAHGKPVVLALAPVDPRALMQGDYMALDFAVAREAAQDPTAPARGYVVVKADAQGVARLVRIQAEPGPLDAGEAALRYRRGRTGLRVAPDAFFFPEGQAQHYARARYGLLRVDDRGHALLAGLLDADRQPL